MQIKMPKRNTYIRHVRHVEELLKNLEIATKKRTNIVAYTMVTLISIIFNTLIKQ